MNSNAKTPLSVLHQLCLRKGYTPQYNLVSQEGKIHEPQFVFNCHVSDLTSTGQGTSKKKSKHRAAQSMLIILTKLEKIDHPLFDLKEAIIKMVKEDKELFAEEENEDNVSSTSNVSKSNSADAIDDNSEKVPKDNPVGELLDICIANSLTPPTYDLVDAFGMAHERTFVIEAKLDKYAAKGEAKSKKLAKRLASIALLAKVKEEMKDLVANTTQKSKISEATTPIDRTYYDVKCNVYPINQLIRENENAPNNETNGRTKVLLSSQNSMYYEFKTPGPALSILKTLNLPRTEMEIEQLVKYDTEGVKEKQNMAAEVNAVVASSAQTSDEIEKLNSDSAAKKFNKIKDFSDLLKEIAMQQDFSLNFTHHLNRNNTKFPYIVYLELLTTPVITNAALGESKKEAYDRCLLSTLQLIQSTLNAHRDWQKAYQKVLDLSETYSANLVNNPSNLTGVLMPGGGGTLEGQTMENSLNENLGENGSCQEDNTLFHPDIYEIPIENIINTKELERNLQQDKNKVASVESGVQQMMSSHKEFFFGDDANKTSKDIEAPSEINADDVMETLFGGTKGLENDIEEFDEDVDTLFADFDTAGTDSKLSDIISKMDRSVNR